MTLSIETALTLANGVEMPLFGLGTYKAEEGFEVEHEIEVALAAGYRAIDTASLYGNEAGVGSAVRASGLAREDLFITTKVWNDDQGYESTLSAFERSLGFLGMDYVDLYLVHWFIPERLAGTWRAMEEILASGRTRAIGVCNFLPHHLETLRGIAKVDPMLDQVEHHPRLQQPELREYCRTHGIALEAWAPIMRGRVAGIPELVEIGRRHSKSPAQVALRWIVQHGVIAIPKSVHAERIRENAAIFDFELSDAEMTAIDALDTGERIGPDPDRYMEA
jgi:diketogulonate reductase-like aldo/keto reductase